MQHAGPNSKCEMEMGMSGHEGYSVGEKCTVTMIVTVTMEIAYNTKPTLVIRWSDVRCSCVFCVCCLPFAIKPCNMHIHKNMIVIVSC